ncbi:MAG: class I SAM-dependent methyltransferase [Planctomycetota bacterium]
MVVVARNDFDAAYYARFYGDAKTRVGDRKSVRRLADFVCAYLRFLEVPVREVVDLGCGLGHWQPAIAAHFPRARYTGVEVSDYLCRRKGWTQGSAVDYHHPRPADLVLCQGVLQYLSDRDAKRAIDNFARLTRGALYLEALTAEDWQHNCDRTATDGNVHLRPANFYRRALRRKFTACGGGVYVRNDAGVALFELERGA